MKIILLGVLLVFFKLSYAQSIDLGKIGETYTIAEENLIDVIKKRMEERVKSGEVAREYNALQERTKRYIKRPHGVRLPRAKEHKVTALDPIYTAPEDIVDADNKVLVKAGTQVNPLEVMPLKKTLCFIDGDDSEQVKWMQTYCLDPFLNKVILTNGNWVELSQKLKMHVYFDQNGYITERFNIRALPAVARQQGHLLYVEEFPIQ